MTNFYIPPPFRVCTDCEGKGHKKNHKQYKPGTCYPMEYACKRCEGLGYIRIWYTIQQWEELNGRKVPDDMLVWWLDEYGHWYLGLSGYVISDYVVIATEAGSPPKDWRPE